MTESLKELNYLESHFNNEGNFEDYCKVCDVLEKKLKVFDILATKILQVSEYDVLEVRDNIELTEEESKLLIEVLK